MTRLFSLLLVLAISFAYAAEGSVTPIIPVTAPRATAAPPARPPTAVPGGGTLTPPPPPPATVTYAPGATFRARRLVVTVWLRPGTSVTLPGLGTFANPTGCPIVVRLVAGRATEP